MSSWILIIVGGGTAGLFGDLITTAWAAAAIGAGAPGVLRTMATLAPRIVQISMRSPIKKDDAPKRKKFLPSLAKKKSSTVIENTESIAWIQAFGW